MYHAADFYPVTMQNPRLKFVKKDDVRLGAHHITVSKEAQRSFQQEDLMIDHLQPWLYAAVFVLHAPV